MKSKYYKKLENNPNSYDIYMAIKHDGYYVSELNTFIIFYFGTRYSVKEGDEYHDELLAYYIAERAKGYLIKC